MGQLKRVHETDGLEHLSQVGLDVFDGEAHEAVFFQDLVQAQAQLNDFESCCYPLEHHTVVLVPIEGLYDADDVRLLAMVSRLQVLQYILLSLSAVHVALYCTDDLEKSVLRDTFIAYSLLSCVLRTSSTRPNVPSHRNFVTTYLPLNSCPTTYLKWPASCSGEGEGELLLLAFL